MTGQATPRGFTIIEVMLFLAITGLMLAGMFVGISGSIDRQRYQDAVTSMTDFIQGQYNLVNNVNTNRAHTLECDSDDGIAFGSGQQPGTSDCTIVGRYVTTEGGNGTTMVSRPIFAQADINSIARDSYGTELEYIELMNLATTDLFDDDNETYTVAWGTHVYTDKDAAETSRDFTLVLIRMPSNGLTRTYAVSGANKSLGETIEQGATATEPFVLCVAPDGLIRSPASGMKLLPLAANTSGIQPVRGSEDLC